MMGGERVRRTLSVLSKTRQLSCTRMRVESIELETEGEESDFCCPTD